MACDILHPFQWFSLLGFDRREWFDYQRLRGDQINCCATYLTIRTIFASIEDTYFPTIGYFLRRHKLICIGREIS